MDSSRPLWRAVWRAPVAQRVRHFLWLASRERLFTNVERTRRHMAEDSACNFCGQPESAIHVLRDCDKARRIWLALVPTSDRREFFLPDVRAWIWSNLVEYSPVGLDNLATVFSITCWRLWAWRNKVIFANTVVPMEAQLTDIRCRVDRHVTCSFYIGHYGMLAQLYKLINVAFIL
ncbi:Ribonuclease H-like superfamily protein [Striga hermonthica]|uniref:Ribonuclease H-like superfamily protein n=1 Tax=Striga hermonthica TaxID=68872 RepID=A0A9N7N6Y0_STRHE|nr:Ribonuclease H-like superfamily protein [Striga hermonthica]